MQSKVAPTLSEKYADAFWDKFESVSAIVDAHRAELKQFMGMIENRSKVQQNYSEKLQQLYTVKYEKRTSMVGHLIKSYLVEVRKRSEQARIFASTLMSEVVNKIRDAIDGTNVQFRKVTSMGKTADKQLQKIREVVDKNRSKHLKRKKQMEEAQLLEFVMSTCKQYGAEKKSQQRQKVRERTAEFKEVTIELNNSLDQYNKFIVSYQTTMRHIMAKYSELEKQRIGMYVSSVANIYNSQITSLKNVILELEQKNKSVNQSDINKELIEYTEKNKKRSGRVVPAVREKQHNFMSSTVQRLNSKELEQVLQYGKLHKTVVEKFFKEQDIEEDQQTKKTVEVARIFTRAWNGQSLETDLSSLESLMDNVFTRKDFVLCMQHLRIMAKFQIAQGCLNSVVRMVNVALDACLNHKDGYTGKQIMVLVFTYYVLQSSPPVTSKQQSTSTEEHIKQQVAAPVALPAPSKVYLQQYVKDHSLWREKDFWDCAFMQSIYEQSKVNTKGQTDFPVTNSSGKISFQREQNLVFTQLAYYVHNMVLFSIPEKQIKAFANKFIKMYNLDQQRTGYIYNNIENSLKEEKKLQSKNSEKSEQKEEVTTPETPPTKFMSSFRKMFE